MVTHDILDAAEERALIARYQQGDLRAGDRVIACHQRFVAQQAMHWVKFGAELEDLVQEGNIGMMVALRRFDLGRGLRFTTYAVWWIRWYIRTAMKRQRSVVRRRDVGPPPSADASLDAPIGDGETTRLEMLVDDGPGPENLVVDRAQGEHDGRELSRLLRGLNAREREVVARRHLTEEPETLAAVGASLDLSRESIRQIELRAFEKMRRRLAA